MTQSSDSGFRRLIKAVKRGDVDAIDSLAKAGVDVNGHNEQSMTPLCVAAVKGNTRVMRALLDAGAELNRLGLGFSPLYWAQFAGQKKAAGLLREAGAKRIETDLIDGRLETVYADTDIGGSNTGE
jgi:uncharacterized protein